MIDLFFPESKDGKDVTVHVREEERNGYNSDFNFASCGDYTTASLVALCLQLLPSSLLFDSFLVHDRYILRVRKKLQFEETKQAYQRRALSDSETARWLNHAIEKIWPVCVEQIASQKLLLPIIPWFLDKYKPWTAKTAVMQHLYLGRNPPIINEVRVLHHSSDDDHLVLEMGMNFLAAEDMSAVLAVKLRKRLGFGMCTKVNITGMHIEGKVLVGVKFLRDWPFLGRLRICFAELPYFQMTAKPIFTHGLDMTEFPGIAGWLDKLLSTAFEQTLVEPNMLVVDVEKFTSPQAEPWFSVDEKEPIAYCKVEVVEAADMKPSDLNGLADPYVKGQLGAYSFRTKIQRKTLAPKWQEEFKVPIISWESQNLLIIEVLDKDHFLDDVLGDCSININDYRDGQRHDIWSTLQNIETGRLHFAVTIIEDGRKGVNEEQEFQDFEEAINFFTNDTSNRGSVSSASSGKSPSVPDNFEPIHIAGQSQTGVWAQHPGSEVSQTWEPRKGKGRLLGTKIHGEAHDSDGSCNLFASGPLKNDSNSNEKGSFRRRINKIGSALHWYHREDQSTNMGEPLPTRRASNIISAINEKEMDVKPADDDTFSRFDSSKVPNELASTAKGDCPDSPRKGNGKGVAKRFLKHAGKSARSLKNVLSRKGSSKFKGDIAANPEETFYECVIFKDENTPSVIKMVPVDPKASSSSCGNDSLNAREVVLHSYPCNPPENVENSLEIRSRKQRECSSSSSLPEKGKVVNKGDREAELRRAAS